MQAVAPIPAALTQASRNGWPDATKIEN